MPATQSSTVYAVYSATSGLTYQDGDGNSVTGDITTNNNDTNSIAWNRRGENFIFTGINITDASGNTVVNKTPTTDPVVNAPFSNLTVTNAQINLTDADSITTSSDQIFTYTLYYTVSATGMRKKSDPKVYNKGQIGNTLRRC